MSLPPLGDPHYAQRTCTRVVGQESGRELLCGNAGVRHVVWWWRQSRPGENLDDCWDHGYVCAAHWPEVLARWTFAMAHPLTAACGMPGSRCSLDENTCFFDGLEVAEPDRTIAVGLPVAH